MRNKPQLGMWTAIIIAIFVALSVANRERTKAPPPAPARVSDTARTAPAAGNAACAPGDNAKFAQSIASGRHIVEGVRVCGIVESTPYERGGEHGKHLYIAVRVNAPGGASYRTQVIPNEELIGRLHVQRGDALAALGQFVYPNERHGYDGLIHDTHPATHRGAADGYVSVNGTVYR